MDTELPPTGPTHVGFATPQLMPASLNDSDIQLEDLFNSTDPLFINPQLLDPSFDSSFFTGSSIVGELNSGSTTTLDTTARNGSIQSSTNQSMQSYDDSVSPNNTNLQDYSWLNVKHEPGPLNLNGSPTHLMDTLNPIPNGMSPSFSDPLQPDFISHYYQNASNPVEADFSNILWDQEGNKQNQIPSLFDKPDKARAYNPPKSSYVITPQLRLHILTTISTPTPFTSNQHPQLPSTPELQLYIDAYASHFSPHLPFLHHNLEFNQENVPLVLSMAAIGALYLSERAHSANIFEISRCCVHVYLESRRERKQDQKTDHEVTPLWLVQALLLGVVYGLFNEDPLANEIAVAQTNAVISLAKSAGLHLPPRTFMSVPDPNHSSVEEKWNYFVIVQERIRTMHVVHIISTLLATGYNVVSTLKNSDIRCGSPCDENLWRAATASEWWTALTIKESDGSLGNAVEGPDFLDCLQRLLSGNTLVGEIPQFTLLTLICAIHLDIHEKRLEYDQHQPTPVSTSPFTDEPFVKMEDEPGSVPSEGSETILGSIGSPSDNRDAVWLEREKRRVEAVLRAWETTWSLSPHASLIPRAQEGSLMSDSIPMSSLAHVRLYLDLRKTKECFWKRDFAGMGRELDQLATPVLYDVQAGTRKQFNALLEAASYAADTISLWEKHSARWTLQATASHTFVHNIVALFDCGLIVSEFFYRLEKRDQHTWAEDEKQLVSRLRKIFFRVFDVFSSLAESKVLHNPLQRNGSDATFYPGKSRTGSFNSDAGSHDGHLMGSQRELMQPLSLMALSAVRKILCTIYIWPFAVTMSNALQCRMDQISQNLNTSQQYH